MAEILVSYALYDEKRLSKANAMVDVIHNVYDYISPRAIHMNAQALLGLFAEKYLCVVTAFYMHEDPHDPWQLHDWVHFLERQKHIGRMI